MLELGLGPKINKEYKRSTRNPVSVQGIRENLVHTGEFSLCSGDNGGGGGGSDGVVVPSPPQTPPTEI